MNEERVSIRRAAVRVWTGSGDATSLNGDLSLPETRNGLSRNVHRYIKFLVRIDQYSRPTADVSQVHFDERLQLRVWRAWSTINVYVTYYNTGACVRNRPLSI